MPKAPALASSMYEAFHRFPPRKIGEFHASFAIPPRAVCQGTAVNVLYRSDKDDPETFQPVKKPVDYIHDHDPGVNLYVPVGGKAFAEGGKECAVPAWLRGTDALVKLGECLGFAFRDHNGVEHDAEGRAPLPVLYCTPNGKALVVVQGEKALIALVWGGKLGVEPRGIVG